MVGGGVVTFTNLTFKLSGRKTRSLLLPLVCSIINTDVLAPYPVPGSRSMQATIPMALIVLAHDELDKARASVVFPK